MTNPTPVLSKPAWKYLCDDCGKKATLKCDDCGSCYCKRCGDSFTREEGDECPKCEPPTLWEVKNERIK